MDPTGARGIFTQPEEGERERRGGGEGG